MPRSHLPQSRAVAYSVALFLICFAVSAGGMTLRAEEPPARSRPELLRKSYQSKATGERREYYLYLPGGYFSEEGKRWPIILFLHGGGERGDGLADLEKTLVHGPLREAWVQGRDLPFILIGPQLPLFGTEPRVRDVPLPPLEKPEIPPPPRERGERPSQPMGRSESGDLPRWDEAGLPNGWFRCEDDLLAMVDTALNEYRGDPGRVYLTGLSYGGFGTWYMGMTHPERWAAIAPVCGAGNAKMVHRLVEAQTPVWIITGGRDTNIRPEWALETARALEKAGHPDVRVTVHEDLGHNVWTRVYEGWDLYQWFLSHRREPR